MTKVLSEVLVYVKAEMVPKRWNLNDPPEKQEASLVAEAKDFERLVRQHVRPHMDVEFSCFTEVEREFKCSGCGYRWTEDSATFNGGCCDEDMKNDPEAVSAVTE